MHLNRRSPVVRFVMVELLAIAFWGVLATVGLVTLRMAGELFILSQAAFIAAVFGERYGASRR
jgi:CHASE2 domain-containing sensor protein